DASGQRRISPVPQPRNPPPTLLGDASTVAPPVGRSSGSLPAAQVGKGGPVLRSGGYGVVKPGQTNAPAPSAASSQPKPLVTGGYKVATTKAPAYSTGGYRTPGSVPPGSGPVAYSSNGKPRAVAPAPSTLPIEDQDSADSTTDNKK